MRSYVCPSLLWQQINGLSIPLTNKVHFGSKKYHKLLRKENMNGNHHKYFSQKRQ